MIVPVELLLRAQEYYAARIWTDEMSLIDKLQSENPDKIRYGGGLASVDPEIHHVRKCLIAKGAQIMREQLVKAAGRRK